MTVGRDPCDRYWEAVDLRASGCAVPEAEAAFVERHVLSCPECAMEKALSGAVRRTPGPGPAVPLDGAAADRWADDVLRAADAGLSEVAGPESGRAEAEGPAGVRARAPLPRRWFAAAGLAAAAAVAALLIALWPAPAVETGVRSPVAGVPATVFLAAGVVDGRAAPVRAGDALAPGDTLAVGEGRAGLTLCGAVDVFLDRRSRVRVAGAVGGRCEVFLESGRVVASVRGLPAGMRAIVSTAAGAVEATGTLFAVEVTGADAEVRVLEGSVLVTAPARPPRKLAAMRAARVASGVVREVTGAEAERDRVLASWSGEPHAGRGGPVEIGSVPPGARPAADVPPPPPVAVRVTPADAGFEAAIGVRPDADRGRSVVPGPSGPPDARVPDAPVAPERVVADLLADARALRAAGDWTGAAATYEEIVRRFAGSREARTALVPLGEMRLERLGDPAGALEAFEAYLSAPGPGALAEEASWGRIRALRAMGRHGEEAGALRSFLARYPVSVTAPEALRRLAEMGEQP